MERILQDVNAVVGVTGSFVCDSEGTLVARAMPSVFHESSFLPAARTILQSIEGLETTRRRRVHELDLVYQEGRMVVKNLRVGCLYILCVRTINVPLLNLTANVAARKLTEMLKEREPAPPSAPARPAEAKAEEEAAVVQEELPAEAVDLLLARARQAVAAAEEQEVHLRLLGGIAVKAVCPSAGDITLPPDGLDLDFAVYGGQRRELDEVLEGLGYEPHRRFNAFHGHRRLKYSESEQGFTLDVFVDTFHMCHQLPFENRLELRDETLPLADLLLSKLQIVQMGEKDLRDIYAILYDYELGTRGEANKVDTDFITSICGDDWGWYKTVTLNIDKSIELADDFLPGQQKEIYVSRARQLRKIVESAPKSLRWQARARIGEARRWYDLPEE